MNKKLTHKEEEIMQILWHLQMAFVNDIIDKMESPKPPYNTVSSTVRKLVSEGIVGFEAFGKTHRYFPILQKEDYRKTAFSSFLQRYFDDSPKEVLSYFVNEKDVNLDELDALLKILKDQQ